MTATYASSDVLEERLVSVEARIKKNFGESIEILSKYYVYRATNKHNNKTMKTKKNTTISQGFMDGFPKIRCKSELQCD